MEGREGGKGELDREPSGMGQTGNGTESGVCGGGNHLDFHLQGQKANHIVGNDHATIFFATCKMTLLVSPRNSNSKTTFAEG